MSATILTPAFPARTTGAAPVAAAAVATFTSTPPVAVPAPAITRPASQPSLCPAVSERPSAPRPALLPDMAAPARGVSVPAVLIQRYAAAVDLNHKMAASHLGLALERLTEAAAATGDIARDALAKATGHAKLATRHLAEADAAIAKLRQMPGGEG